MADEKTLHEFRSEDIPAARDLIAHMCKYGNLKMSIPPQRDDGDLLLSRVIEKTAAVDGELYDAINILILSHLREEEAPVNFTIQYGGTSHIFSEADYIKSWETLFNRRAEMRENGVAGIAYIGPQKKIIPAAVRGLIAALEQATTQFAIYAEHHLKKSPPDDAKAETNLKFAKMCADALLQYRGY